MSLGLCVGVCDCMTVDVVDSCMQHLEDFHIKPLLDLKRISFYSRYVDDILVIYDTKPETIVHHANSKHSNIRLSPTLETNN